MSAAAASGRWLDRVADGRPEHRSTIRRLDGVFGAIAWWAMHLAAMYWLTPRTCELGSHWPLHVVTAILVALCARAWLSAVQVLRAARAADPATDPTARRDLYLGWMGVLFSLFFGAVTAFEWIPSLILDGCW